MSSIPASAISSLPLTLIGLDPASPQAKALMAWVRLQGDGEGHAQPHAQTLSSQESPDPEVLRKLDSLIAEYGVACASDASDHPGLRQAILDQVVQWLGTSSMPVAPAYEVRPLTEREIDLQLERLGEAILASEQGQEALQAEAARLEGLRRELA